MKLAGLVRTAVGLAQGLTSEDLQATVQHRARTGHDGYKPTLADPVARTAIVETSSRLIRRPDGSEVLATTKLSFLQNVTIGAEDVLTLPDGSTGPILDIKGLADPAGGAFFVQVWLGMGKG